MKIRYRKAVTAASANDFIYVIFDNGDPVAKGSYDAMTKKLLTYTKPVNMKKFPKAKLNSLMKMAKDAHRPDPLKFAVNRFINDYTDEYDKINSSCGRKSVKAGYQLQFPYMVEGEFADGYTYTAGGNSEAECVETLADMQDKHGELVWYSGITDEDYDAGRRIDSACSRKSVKSASGNIKNKSRNVQVYFWQNNAYNAVVFTDGEYWIVFDGDSNGKFDGSVDLYDEDAVSELKSYIKNADFNSFDEMYNEFSQDQGSMSPAVGDNFGREFDKNELTKVGTIYEGKAEASTGSRRYSKIMAGAGAGYTIKWTLDEINKVNSFNVVNVSRMDSYGTVTVTADCDIDVTVTINSASSYMYGFSDPIEGVSAKITRIIFDMYTLDWSFLSPNDYENGEADEAYQEAIESAIYELNENDAYNILEEEARENIESGEFNFGGGWIHSTYDGTLNEIDGDYNWVDIKITDEAVINYIDRCVSGDCTSTSYVLYDSDNEIIETFNDLKEAESVAWDLTDVGEYDYIDIWEVDDFENLNGDVEITGDRFIETIPERDDDEVLPWEDEEEY